MINPPSTQIKVSSSTSSSSSMEAEAAAAAAAQVTKSSEEEQSLDLKTPPPQSPCEEALLKRASDSTIEMPITCTPDRLNLPKPFKYPERYTSPTDSMISPITKGLLARHRRRPAALLPPTLNHRPHIPDLMMIPPQDVTNPN